MLLKGQLLLLASVGTALAFTAVGVWGCGTDPQPTSAAPSPSSTVSDPSGGGGTCSQEGATQACHITLGETDGVLDCFAGIETCVSGNWTTCGTGGGTFSSRRLAPGQIVNQSSSIHTNDNSVPLQQGGGDPLGIVDAGPGPHNAPDCDSDSCNPYCWDYYESTPIGGGPGSSTPTDTTNHDNDDPGILGPEFGFISGLACPIAEAAGADCQFDSCCVPDPFPFFLFGKCHKNSGGACSGSLAKAPACSDPDFTAGAGCGGSDGDVHIPICNRNKNTDANSGTLTVGIGDSGSGLGSIISGLDSLCAVAQLTGNGQDHCDLDLGANPIPADTCVDLDLGPKTGTSANGARPGGWDCKNVTYSPGPVFVFVNVGTPPNPRLAECGGVPSCNNLSEVFPTDTCTPDTTTKNLTPYQAICPAGSQPNWRYLTWNSSGGGVSADGGTPDGGSPPGGSLQISGITSNDPAPGPPTNFRPQTAAPTQNFGPAGSTTPIPLVDTTMAVGQCVTVPPTSSPDVPVYAACGTDPGVCTSLGSGCAKALNATMDANNSTWPSNILSESHDQWLQLTVNVSHGLTLNSWNVDYDCVPNE